MSAVLTASGAGGFTQTFTNTMTITGSSNISLTGNGAGITTNGKLIPNLSITANKTLNDDLNVINFTNGVTTVTGQQIFCSGNWTGSVNTFAGSTVINLIGTGVISLGLYSGTGGININTAGTLSGSTIGIGLASNTVLNYSGGTLSQMKLKMAGTPITINSGSGVEFETFDFYAQLNPSTLNIPNEFKVKYFNGVVASTAHNPLTQTQLTIAGAGALNVTNSMNLLGAVINTTGVIQYKPFNLAFSTGVTHTIASLNSVGFNTITSNTTASATNGKILSASPGVRANVNLLNPSQSMISNTDIIDINFTGPTAYKYLGGIITNSLNVVNITSMGTLTTERSSVYVN
jgi:hypothetical protein